MSQPFNTNPDQVGDAGAGWDADILDFGAPQPQVSGHPNDPTVAASQQAIDNAQRRTRMLQQGVGRTADQTRQAAGAYGNQEKQSAWKLGDGTGPISDIAGTIGQFPSAIEPLLTEAASFGGQMISTGASTVFQTIQQVTSALTAHNTANIPPPNAGIGLPPADQYQNHPNADLDTTAAAPLTYESGHDERTPPSQESA
jgi:hypothetical protein